MQRSKIKITAGLKNNSAYKKSAQEAQDRIFKRMDASEKIRLTFSISGLIIKINSIVKNRIEKRYLVQWAIDELARFANGNLTPSEENDLKLLKKYAKIKQSSKYPHEVIR